MDLSPRPFTDMAKPTVIPFIGDTRPSKGWDFSEYSDSDSFGNRLSQNISALEENNPSLSAQKKSFSSTVSTLQLATLKKGLDNFSLGQLSNIEFTANKQNYEQVNKPNYVDYRTYLYTPLDQLSGQAIKPTKDNKKEDETYLEESDEDAPSRGHTIAHNVNLYNGFSTFNPFKKEDKANYDAFNKDKTMQLLTSNFMSPLRVLGQNVWNMANYNMAELQDKSAKLEGLSDVYNDNKIETFDVLSNYESVIRDYSVHKEKKSLWTPEMFFSFILRRWSDAKNFYKNATLLSGKVSAHVDQMNIVSQKDVALEENTGFEDYIGSMNGLLDDLNTLTGDTANIPEEALASTEDIAKISSNLDELIHLLDGNEESLNKDQVDAINQIRAQYDSLNLPTIDKTYDATDYSLLDDWWNRVGNEVPDYGMLMPIGVFAESGDAMAEAMELGNWDGLLTSKLSQYVTDKPGGFMDDAFTNYIQYASSNFFPTKDATGIVTPEDLAIDNVNYGKAVFEQLHARGYITADGHVTDKFKADDITTDIGITNDYTENDRIRGVLRSALLGSFDLETIDHKSESNKDREQIKLIGPEGNEWTLDSIQELIGSGNSLDERYDNTRRAYNILFDMYESMSGLSINSVSSNGRPNIRQIGANQYEMDVYSHAKWQEYHADAGVVVDKYGKEHIVGEWRDSGDQPLTLQFQSQGDAEHFFDQIQGMLATLEPILGSLEPDADVGPGRFGVSYQDGEPVKTRLRVISDNEGMLGQDGIVVAGSADHAMSVDYVHHASYFKTEHWQNVSKELANRIMLKVGKGIFNDVQVNRMYRAKNKRDREEYKERKQEHDDKEYERIKSELRSYYKRLAEQKQSRKAHAMKTEQRLHKLLAESKKAAAMEQKRLAEARAAKKREEKLRDSQRAAAASGASSTKKKK